MLERKTPTRLSELTALRAEEAKTTFDVSLPFLDETQIKTAIHLMAEDIEKTLRDTAPVVLTIYPEGAHFSNHLTVALAEKNLTLEENYIDLSIENGQPVMLVEPLVNVLKGRYVLITTAVLKDGQVLAAVMQYCQEKGAKAVYCAALVNMSNARADHLKDLQPNFCRVHTDDNLQLAGFGMDLDGFYRNQLEIRSYPATSSTTAILLTLDAEEKVSAPLILQENVEINEEALAQARQAKETFSNLEQILTAEQVEAQVKLTAEEMQKELQGRYPVVLTMQKGGSHFTTYLTEQMPSLIIEESYLHITRYGHSQQGGEAKILAKPATDLKGRYVVIADDIIEGGMTMDYAIKMCEEMGAKKVYLACLGDKPQKRLKDFEHIQPNFRCFTFDNRFLVGTGLDEKEFFRNYHGMWAHSLPTSENVATVVPRTR